MKPFVADNLRPVLRGKKILLGVSGSIAAFKACDLVRYLRDCEAEVKVVLTDSAQKFVTPLTLETLSGRPVMTSMWPGDQAAVGTQGTHHIDLARWADLMLIAPATANTIAKLAGGIADDLLSTEYLAFIGPVMVAPAMNPAMFSHPAVQENLEILQERGLMFLGPVQGETSCGEVGPGRMVEPEYIIERVAEVFFSKPKRKRVLITTGPTRSMLDPVRYLTNRSSGLMGAALAWAAVKKGYDVTVLTGVDPTKLSLPTLAKVKYTPTAQEMFNHACDEFEKSDYFIGAAAVLDWDFAEVSAKKIKKEDGAPKPTFRRTPDILAELAKVKKSHQCVVGFSAETDQPLENAIRKLQAKGCDAIFANLVGQKTGGFESELNGGWWILNRELGKEGILEIPLQPKTVLAERLVELMEQAPEISMQPNKLLYFSQNAAQPAAPEAKGKKGAQTNEDLTVQ